MAWATTKGFNFRSTVAFVTDGANQIEVENSSPNGLYPTTNSIGGDSVTYGWDIATTIRDRVNTNDPRLAGMHFANSASGNLNFRVDLPAAGTYKYRLAIGDGSFAQPAMQVRIYDNTTLLTNVNVGTSVANHFIDATGNDLTNVTWPGSNAQVTQSFATTILIMRISGDVTNTTCIAHLEVEQASGDPDQHEPFVKVLFKAA
jgi:hypothetical protein